MRTVHMTGTVEMRVAQHTNVRSQGELNARAVVNGVIQRVRVFLLKLGLAGGTNALQLPELSDVLLHKFQKRRFFPSCPESRRQSCGTDY
jgi:hypothetical protein